MRVPRILIFFVFTGCPVLMGILVLTLFRMEGWDHDKVAEEGACWRHVANVDDSGWYCIRRSVRVRAPGASLPSGFRRCGSVYPEISTLLSRMGMTWTVFWSRRDGEEVCSCDMDGWRRAKEAREM